MSIRCRVRLWTSLSACLGLSLLTGCGGSTPAPQAAAPAATSAPAPAPAPTPDTAPDPSQTAESGGDGYTPPGGEEQNSGMANSGQVNSGMGGMMGPGDPSLSVNSGMSGMSGMPSMGGPGAPGMIPPGGLSSDYSGMTSSMAGPGGGGTAGMESIGGPGMGMGMNGMAGGMGMGMGGMAGAAIADPAPAEDADYLSKGKYAFAIGKESAAEAYVIAEMLANEASASSLVSQIRFSPTLRKPALTLRFGVGVNLESPSTITDYKPIGRTQFAGQNNGQGMGSGEPMGMMGSGAMTGGGQAAGGAQKSFGDYTGRFGEELIKSFEGAWDSGTFGSVFADVETITPINKLGPGNQNNRMMEMSSGMSGMSGMNTGMGPTGIGMDGMGGMNGQAAPATNDSLRLRATPGKPIVPGLTYLGTGKESELLGKAETEGVDYIFLFEVKVEMKRQRQGQMVSNDTKLRLLSVKESAKDKRTLGSTSTLNNIKVDVAMAEKGDNDEVAKNLGNLFRKVDGLKLVDMPKMKPESAQARIKSLIEKKTKDVLPILMEIKMFHSQGLLGDEERDAAFQLTMPNGLAFVNGSAEDRAFVLEPLLPGYK